MTPEISVLCLARRQCAIFLPNSYTWKPEDMPGGKTGRVCFKQLTALEFTEILGAGHYCGVPLVNIEEFNP